MLEKNNELLSHLIDIGQVTYYQMHNQILEEMCPSGDFSSTEWNEATVEAVIAAVAKMIQENNALLLTKTEQSKENI